MECFRSLSSNKNPITLRCPGMSPAGAALEKAAAQQERGIKRLYDAYTAQQEAVGAAQDQLDAVSNEAHKVGGCGV